jgi:hypothetical protein
MSWNEFGDFLAMASDQDFFTLFDQQEWLSLFFFKGSKTTQKLLDKARSHLAYLSPQVSQF